MANNLMRNWIKNISERLLGTRRARRLRAKAANRHDLKNIRPKLELLEDRVTPSNYNVVDLNGAAGSGSPSDVTLPYAVANAGYGDTITFDPSIYGGTIVLNSPLSLNNGVTVTGPGSGNIAVSGNDALQVFNINGGVLASITGLTIENGNSGGNGGGIDNSGNLTLSNDVFNGNHAVYGGGICNEASGTLSVSNCTFSNNSAGSTGGGAFNFGTLTLSNSTFTNNTGLWGGGVANGNFGTFSPTLAVATVTGCTFVQNHATASNSGGGGVDNLNGMLTLSNSTVANNSAYSGGGVNNNGGLMNLSNDTIAYNTATIGGGVSQISYFGTPTLNVANCIISNNNAPTDPGVDVGSGSIANFNNNLVDNSAGLTYTSGTGNLLNNANANLAPSLGSNGGPTQTLALQQGSSAIYAGGALTTLSAAIGTGTTTIDVTNAAAIAQTPSGDYILIDGEQMLVTNVDTTSSPNTLTVQRGAGAVSHNAGSSVYLATDQRGDPTLVQPNMGAWQGAYAPTVVTSTASLPSNSTLLVIQGTGYDPDTAYDSVSLNPGATATVVSATTTSLTLSVNVGSLSAGTPLNATVTVGGLSNAAPTQVATIANALYPTITTSTSNLPHNATTIIINGTNFDPNPANDAVAFNLGATGTVISANGAGTQLTVALTSPPTSLGNLDAVFTDAYGISSPSEQVATVVNATWVVTDAAGSGGSLADVTLPYAVSHAFSGDTITFASSLSGDTIHMTSTLTLNANVTINGSGAPGLVVSGIPAQGLTGQYFNIGATQSLIQPAVASNANWLGNQTPAVTATLVGPIDFPNINENGNNDGFLDTEGNFYYAVGNNSNVEGRWYGEIMIPDNGLPGNPINFATSSDDGSMLYIDGNPVVNNNYFQGTTQRTGLVYLTPGLHNIDVEYYNGGGGASMDAAWDPTGGNNFVDIPNSAFVLPGAPVQVFNVPTGVSASISNLTIENGGGSNSGGGVYNAGTLTLSGDTFTKNSASFGGAVYNSSAGTLTVTNSTITGNSANDSTGGVYNVGTLSLGNDTIAYNNGVGLGAYGTTTIQNTIVADNTGEDIAGSSSASGNYNLTDDFSGGSISGTHNQYNVNAGVAASLASNGGPTQTLALLSTSAAIAAGDPGQVGTTAQNAVVRPSLPDVGAYQTPAPTVTLNTTTLPANATNVVIHGTYFASNTALDSVTFDDGVTGIVTSATGTSMTVSLTNLGAVPVGTHLDAVVTVGSQTSGSAVQVATVGVALTVASSTTSIADNSPTIIIHGTGFDTTLGDDSVTFNLGLAGTITAVNGTGTQLTVAITSPPTALGALTAVVNSSFGGFNTGAPVQVATEINANWIVTDGAGSGGSLSDVTLPYAVASALSGDTIGFASSLSGQTITADGTLTVNSNVTINGSGAPGLKISATTPNQGLIGQYFQTPGNGGTQQEYISPASLSNPNWLGQPTLPAGVNLGATVRTSGSNPLDMYGGNGNQISNNGFETINGITYYNFGNNNNNVEARWYGEIMVPNNGQPGNPISFLTESDDGSMLYIDGVAIVSNNNYQGVTPRTGVVDLSPGLHAIDIEYFNGGGGAAMNAQWDPNGGSNWVDIPNSVLSSPAPTQVFNIPGGVTATITDLTITNGVATQGGGVANAGTLTLSNDSFTQNSATDGGAIANSGTLTMTNSTLTSNTASASGGSIFNTGTLTLSSDTFTKNSAANGGATANPGTLTMTNSTVTGNTASNSGGGVYSFGQLTLNDDTIAYNQAVNAGGLSANGSTEMDNTIVGGNTSRAGLVGQYFNIGATQSLLQNSSGNWLGYQSPAVTAQLTGPIDFRDIADNGFADSVGDPAYYNLGGGNNNNVEGRWYGEIMIPNNGIAGNPISFGTGSDDGSVIYIDGSLVVNNNNFQGVGAYPTLQVHNTVDLSPGLHAIDVEYYNGGGGAAMWAQWDPNGGSSFVDIPNSVFSSPAAPTDFVGSYSGTNNLIGNTTGLAAALGNNGGPTQTLALSPTSPAIGAGGVATSLATDQRGFGRSVVAPDIGAYQLQSITASTALLPVTSTSLVINGTAFDPNPAHDSVTFSNGVTGTVTAATGTSLTVAITGGLTAVTGGTALNATVTVDGVVGGSAQVAMAQPVVTTTTVGVPVNSISMNVIGYGFDTNPANDFVTFNNGVTGTVVSATGTALLVNVTGLSVLSVGTPIDANVTVDSISSGSPVQVATVANALYPTVTTSTSNIADSATTLTIHGTNFDPVPLGNTVAFNLGVAGTVTSATTTQLVVTLTSPPTSLAALTAVVTSYGVSSAAPVQVATETNGTWTVTSSAGSGGSLGNPTLPYAVGNAFSGDTITFAAGLSGDTINLTSTLNLNANVTITNPSAPNLAVSGTYYTQGGLVGTYFNVSASANRISPAVVSNTNWLGNQTPAATALLVGPLDFQDISDNGFIDTQGNQYYNLGGGNNNNVEGRWYGEIMIPGTIGGPAEPINFATLSDDGSVLYVDGNEVVNNNYFQGRTERTGLIDLTPGLHAIDVEYYNGGGGASMTAQWDPAGGSNFVDIPSSAFYYPVSSRVFSVASTVTATISGLTIENGAATSGAGIGNAGTLTLSNDTITGNTASANGGGIGSSGTLTVSDCTFTYNRAASNGGGIANSGTLTVTGSTFSFNSAPGSSGGGLFNYGTLTMSNSTFTNNTADYGGGMENFVLATVTDCTFADNTATASTGTGGGINNFLGTMTLSNSTVVDNTATGTGGGINNVVGSLTLSNDTISGNSAVWGGGVANYGPNTYGPGTVTMVNTIVANNSAGNGPDVSGTIGVADNSLIDNTTGMTISTGSANQLNVPAGLAAALASNGGPTQTLALLGTSTAIATGGAVTTVSQSANGTATTIYVADAAAIASTPGQYYIQIDGEEMEVTNVNTTSNTLTVTRDVGGSPAGSISAGAAVYLYFDQRGVARQIPPCIGAYQLNAWIVTDSNGAAGSGSANDVTLPYAVAQVDAGHGQPVIVFAPTLIGGNTITLNSTLQLTSNVTIQGLGAANLTVSGGNAVGVFNVASGVTATILGMTITNGQATTGGGIDNSGTLNLSGITLSGNAAVGSGSGIYNSGNVTISGNDTISNNIVGPGNVTFTGTGNINVSANVSGVDISIDPGSGGAFDDLNPSSALLQWQHLTHGGITLGGSGTIDIAASINLGAGNLLDSSSGSATISGVISGTSATSYTLSPGLIGQYFHITATQSLISPASASNSNWLGNQTPAATSTLVGPIDFQDISGNGFLDTEGNQYYNLGGGNNNQVEGRWYGDIMIPGSGTAPVPVNFATLSDDGSTLYIDGNLVVNNNYFQGRTERTGLVDLTPGLHTIDVEYYNGGGGASMTAEWDPTGGSNFVDIPNSVLFTVTPANCLTKTGSGTLTLSNTNTYVGTTTIDAGTLIATANGAMGPATAAGITVNAGGALAFSGNVDYTTAEPTTINGSGPAGNGAIDNISGSNTFAAPITLGGNATIGADAGTLTLSNPAALNMGTNNLTTTGAGNIVITSDVEGTAAAAYVGFTGGTGGATSTQNILNWTYTSGGTTIDDSAGFASSNLVLNNGASLVGTGQNTDGTALQLTDGNNSEARTAWTPAPVSIDGFTTTFQWTYGAGSYPTPADGFTFALQDAGNTAVGNAGGALGYGGITGNSLAVQFNQYNNGNTNVSTFGVGLNGAINDQAVNLVPYGVNFSGNPGDIYQATVTENPTNGTLTVSIWDTTLNSASNAPNYTTTISLAPPPTSYVGFTGATGGLNCTQNILNWTYASAGTNINYGSGFASNNLSINGNSAVVGSALQLTNGANGEQGSAWTPTAVPVNGFTTTFQWSYGNGSNPPADGFTFAVQDDSNTFVGGGGSSLGYATPTGISYAAEFNTYNGSGTDSGSDFGVGVNGAIDHNTNLVPFGINFTAYPSHVYQATLSNNGDGTLTVTIWDVTENPTLNPSDTGYYTGTFAVPSTPGTGNLIKDGSGNLTLTNTNSYNGQTIINAGKLIATANGAMGPATGAGIFVNSGGALAFAGNVNYTTAEPAVISGSGPAGNGAIENISGSNTFDSNMTISGAATVGSDAGTLTLGGNTDCTGSGAGAGLTLVGSGDITYTGGVINLGLGGNFISFGRGSDVIMDPITGSAVSAGGVQGLTGQYFNIAANQDLIQPALTSNPSWLGNQTPAVTAQLVGPIDFPDIADNGFADSVGNPAYYNLGGGNNNNVEGRWYGDIIIPGTGTTPVPINFSTSSDDGSMLYIDGNAVVSNNNFQGVTQRTGLVYLTPGLHAIDVEYYNGGGGAAMDAQWDPTGGSNFVDIPNSAFYEPSMNSVTMAGTGTLILSGSNTYIGATTVNSGTLEVDGSVTSSSGTTVASGATLDGNGTTGATTVNGTIMGGTASTPGTLNTDLSFGTTGIFTATLDSASSYSQVVVNGSTVDLSNAPALNVVLGPSFSGTSFDILVNNTGSPINGTFDYNGSPLLNGDTFAVGSTSFSISYFGGESGNDVVLTVVSATPAPTVTSSTARLPANATTMTIDGTNFDTTAGNNTVSFNDGAAGTVTSATTTTLTVTFTTDPTTAGSLTAVVTTDSVTSGSPVQVATVTPVVSINTGNLPANATTLTINGFGFDPTAANDTVSFNDGAAGSVTSATATTLTVTFTTDPTTAGSLTAAVTTDSITSGSPVQVATVTPVVTTNTAGMLQHTPTLTIHGYGFDPTAGNNSVTFNDGAVGTVTSATSTTLVVTFTTAPTAAGSLTAVVTTDSITSGAAVQVATVTSVTSVTVNGDIAPIVDISSNGSGTVTATTDGNNGFTAGNTVVISGYTGANAGYDGTFTVQSASGDQFTVTNTTPSLPTLSSNTAGFAISQNTASALRGNQRSMVDSVVYTFTAPVSLTASNFTLTTSAPSVSGAPSAAPAPATLYPGMALTSLAGGSIWVVTWVSGGGTGATVSGHSLADGVYNITLGNSNEGTDTFFRLYGNVVGYNSTTHTASLNNQDSLTFTHSYLLSTGATQYLADCDYDANGVINNTDSLNFTHRYLSVWSGFLPTI